MNPNAINNRRNSCVQNEMVLNWNARIATRTPCNEIVRNLQKNSARMRIKNFKCFPFISSAICFFAICSFQIRFICIINLFFILDFQTMFRGYQGLHPSVHDGHRNHQLVRHGLKCEEIRLLVVDSIHSCCNRKCK